MIRAYQLVISPALGPCCRFYPSCSEYTRQAIEEWGLARGIYLGARRISRCHPLNEGGLDPVPRRAPDMTVSGPDHGSDGRGA